MSTSQRNGNGRRVRERHEERMAAARSRPPAEPRPNYNGSGEAEVVPGYQLAEEMKGWIKRWLAERPRNQIMKDEYEHQGEPMGPIAWLAENTGIHPRRVQGICNGEFPIVPFSQADLLLTAVGRPYLLGNSIQVVPNPNWTFEKWIDYQRERGSCD